MQNFKLTFTNTSGKLDFLLIDANDQGEAIDLFLENGGLPEQMLAIEKV